ncbi:unnamed protein product [Adineta steineri]|uniref:Uncharacterized protein n=1 Tax=Adineta steineri TaxID=433720 RepID=A0A815CJP5_9BILA|nr:unnamed protein product [Adineta steineri]CAF1285152.1 unnamed protein product [Adineta steineri]
MNHSPSVKITKTKKRRSNGHRRVKRNSSNVSVTRIKSVASTSSKNKDKILVVENVDTIPASSNKPISLSSSKTRERPLTTVSVTTISNVQSIKNITNKSSGNNTLPLQQSSVSKSYMAKSIQDNINTQRPPSYIHQPRLPSNTTTQSFDSNNKTVGLSSLAFDIGDRREIYTIGERKGNKNKKYRCQKCPRRYFVIFGLAALFIVGIVIALPIAITASMTTTTTTTTRTSSTILTTAGTPTTTAATITITSNICTSHLTGITQIAHCDSCSVELTYQFLTYNYVAIANITRIIFGFRRVSGYWGVDDVSIRNTASPNTELLTNGGFESGNFSSWTLCIQSGSSGTGSVQSTSSNIAYNNYTFAARSGSYYYLGGAIGQAEYITQTFPSVIGNSYNFSFAYIYAGSGSLSSGDFLVST